MHALNRTNDARLRVGVMSDATGVGGNHSRSSRERLQLAE
jgi:hypothetical protein